MLESLERFKRQGSAIEETSKEMRNKSSGEQDDDTTVSVNVPIDYTMKIKKMCKFKNIRIWKNGTREI